MSVEKYPPLELYVHIPFCVKKCDYCDFLSGPAGQKTQKAYIQALKKEMQAVSIEREISSIFIGGGTPSVLEPDLMGELLQELKNHFSFASDLEYTIEANPGTLTEEKLKVYRAGGINRLSLGLQSTDDEELQLLGRIHTFHEFLESYQLARKAGFTNINVDLMSAIPGQTYEGWIRNLRTVAALEPEHISAYSLIVEEGTPFATRQLKLPDEDTEYQMYEDTAAVLAEFGYEQYEISNYAKPGFACRHNLGYWERTEYLGLGLGAASLYENRRFSNTRELSQYLEESGSLSKIREEDTILTKQDQMEEFMFLGLRMTKGVSRVRFQEQFGISIDSVYAPVIQKYKKLNLLQEKNDQISLTRKGIHVSNTVMCEFLLS